MRYVFFSDPYFTSFLAFRMLHSLGRHFITACFSLYNTRDTDAQRVTVMAGICTLMDAVLRMSPAKNCSLSPLGGHYNGSVAGPVLPFAFDVSFFADQSEFFLLMDPVLSTARTQVGIFNETRCTWESNELILA